MGKSKSSKRLYELKKQGVFRYRDQTMTAVKLAFQRAKRKTMNEYILKGDFSTHHPIMNQTLTGLWDTRDFKKYTPNQVHVLETVKNIEEEDISEEFEDHDNDD